jgi:micrococcal nuclease
LKSFIKLGFKTVITLAVILLIGYFAWKYILPRLDERQNRDKQQVNKENSTGGETALVKKVFDGDTFEAEINGKTEKIRMLGIDTPEKSSSDKFDRDVERTGKDKKTIQKLGELSHQYTVRLINGKKVILKTEPGGDNKDKYGRLLRYVYLADGTFVNLKIVEDGYANAYRKFKLSKQKEFIEAEKTARGNKKGLWGDIDGLEYFENRDK